MTYKFVIDTNVAISANGNNTHASYNCQLECINFLENCTEKHIIVIDEPGNIMDEYSKHLSYAGQPGVGDMFFKYLYDNQYSTDKILMVDINISIETNRGFEELPINLLDSSDRKFLATAVVAKANIVNATDSDWSEQTQLLKDLNIKVKQICPEHSSR